MDIRRMEFGNTSAVNAASETTGSACHKKIERKSLTSKVENHVSKVSVEIKKLDQDLTHKHCVTR